MSFKKFSLVFTISIILVGCKTLQPTQQNPILDLKTDSDQKNENMNEKVVPTKRATYIPAKTILTDLIHTKLELELDWGKSQLNGKAKITAKPHFFASDSLFLDAKGMDVLAVVQNGKPLNYSYNDTILSIQLNQKYTGKDTFSVVIDYVSKPEERIIGGSAAIKSDKGLYFINPENEEGGRMPQVWTQGETESNSVWFPTIDSPNAKSSQEIWLTVDSKYTTFSNGLMIKEIYNEDGTRTDVWKQEKKHAPYLFMIAVGEFKVVKDSYTRPDGTLMEVNYYVEPEWEPYAKAIFGETPAMIAYFSKLLGIEYQWDKYHQIVVREYVSGAMENTGAVVFGDYVYKNYKALLDGNDQATIAHELFHHWFGDLVTCESWSNLTLNESFANYSQYLWDEHRYGMDEADYQAEIEEKGYYQSAKTAGYHNLVRFDYEHRDDMFDAHSYNKGGRILHMLRSYIGDEAFFKGIQLYLKENSFQSAEFHQLRIAFEKVCGEDLNWFFNQWYLDKAHPILDIKQKVESVSSVVSITLAQVQNLELAPIYKLPMHIAIYDSKGKHVYPIILDELTQTFDFSFEGELKCVVVDDQEMLLGYKREQKPVDQYVYQYYNAQKYKTRRAGLLNGVATDEKDQLIMSALNDSFWDIRLKAIDLVDKMSEEAQKKAFDKVKLMLHTDTKTQVRDACLKFLANYIYGEDALMLVKNVLNRDSSYLVLSTALNILATLQPDEALTIASGFEKEASSSLQSAVAQIYAQYADSSVAEFFTTSLRSKWLNSYDEVNVFSAMSIYLARQDVSTIEKLYPLYPYIQKNGGYYSQMFFDKNVTYLQEVLNEKMLELKANKAIVKSEKLERILNELNRLLQN